MSLVTLTFSNSNNSTANSIGKGKVRVLKTENFFGTEEVCVIGKLVDGAVAKEMCVPGTNKKLVSVESKFGDGSCCHAGAQVVLMIANSTRDEYATGQEIIFHREIIAQEKPKGRIIIA